jgi:hypothetical protein
MGRDNEREVGLIKNHVSRDDQAICGEIKTAIAFVIRRVAKEDSSTKGKAIKAHKIEGLPFIGHNFVLFDSGRCIIL